MANKGTRRKEKKKPKKGTDKITTSSVMTDPPVEVIVKRKPAKGSEE